MCLLRVTSPVNLPPDLQEYNELITTEEIWEEEQLTYHCAISLPYTCLQGEHNEYVYICQECTQGKPTQHNQPFHWNEEFQCL